MIKSIVHLGRAQAAKDLGKESAQPCVQISREQGDRFSVGPLVAHLGTTAKLAARLCPPQMSFQKMNNLEAAEGGRECCSEIWKTHSNLKMD